MLARLALLASVVWCALLPGPLAPLAFAQGLGAAAEPSDKDDPVLGKWRFSVEMPGEDSTFNITFKPGGRTDRAGADWSRDGERLYTISLAGGQTAKLKLDPKGRILIGKNAKGGKVVGLRQASNK